MQEITIFRKAEKVRRPVQSTKPQSHSSLTSPDQPVSMATARMRDRNEVSDIKKENADDEEESANHSSGHKQESATAAAVGDSE